MTKLLSLAATVAGLFLTTVTAGADWPQYRYDASRRAASPESLPENLHLAWVRELPAPRPAFPTEIRLRYDASYEPVILGKTMLVPSMVSDSVTALDTETGVERWRFFTGGPVRLAPVAWEDKVYFVSDDGYLYCVNAGDGTLRWKVRGLPEDRASRNVMGNGRLIPLVPARGGPVLADGVIYFAAGIWWDEGIFVYAVDATSGRVIWANVEGHRIEKANMDHGVAYFAGLSPQGHMAIVDHRLVVPCGSQLPAMMDLKTGKLAPYTMGWGGRVGLAKGCAFVSGTGKFLFHAGDIYDIQQPNQERFRQPRANDFKHMLYLCGLTRLQIDPANQKGLGVFREPVLTPDAMYYQQDGIVASDLTKPSIEERAKSEIPSHVASDPTKPNVEERANPEIPSYRRNDEYPDKMRATFPEMWKLASSSTVHIKAGDRLYCGRAGVVEAVQIPRDKEAPKIGWEAEIEGTPQRMLAADGKLFVVTREGRIYAFGGEERSQVVVHAKPSAPSPEPDAWSERAAKILEATGTTDGYVLALGIGTGRLAEELVRQSRCDVIAIDPNPDKVAKYRKQFQQAGLYGTRISLYVGDPNSYSLPPYFASLIVAEDSAVLENACDRASIRTLFRSLRPYGGTAFLAIPAADRQAFPEAVSQCDLPGALVRQTVDAVLLVRQGPLAGSGNWSHAGANAANTGAARDQFLKPPLSRLWFDSSFRWIRTPGSTVVRVAGGRVFAKANHLDAIDVYTGRHLWKVALPASHNPGGEMVAVEDAIYLTNARECVTLDPETGKKTGQLELPAGVDGRWSHIRVAGDYLVGACVKQLVCVDRRSGELLWKHQRERRVGSIALGGGKVFCADFVRKQRGKPPSDLSSLTTEAFDAQTGKLLWQISGGGDVRYSESHDLLVASSGVFQAADGSRIWNAGGAWPITDDRLLRGTSDGFMALDLLTGTKSSEEMKWFRRGCTPLRASTHLLTTRFQGNASYVDLSTGEIRSIWNVRAACSNNLFPANGVLSVPNLSGGCTCNYMPISQSLVPASVLD
ncbi:MAG: PQQ-binding-like beta-propeller repeat protein [Pirellulaceae bacterium]